MADEEEEENNSGVMATIGRGQPKPDEAEKNNTPEPEEEDPRVVSAEEEEKTQKASSETPNTPNVPRIKKGQSIFGVTPKDASYQTLIDGLVKSGQLLVEEAEEKTKNVSRVSGSDVSKKLTQISKKLSLLNNSLTRLFRITESIKGLLGDQLKWEKKRYEQIEIFKEQQSLLTPKGEGVGGDSEEEEEEEEEKKKKNYNYKLLAALLLLPAVVGFIAYMGDARQYFSAFLLRHTKNIKNIYQATKTGFTSIVAGAKGLLGQGGRSIASGVGAGVSRINRALPIIGETAKAVKEKGVSAANAVKGVVGKGSQLVKDSRIVKAVNDSKVIKGIKQGYKNPGVTNIVKKGAQGLGATVGAGAKKSVKLITAVATKAAQYSEVATKVTKYSARATRILGMLNVFKGAAKIGASIGKYMSSALGKALLVLVFASDILIDAIQTDKSGKDYWKPLFIDVMKALGAVFGIFLSVILSKAAGQAIGGVIGGFLGSIIPGPGTVIGAWLGGAVGGKLIEMALDLFGSMFFQWLAGYIANKISEMYWDGKSASTVISEMFEELKKYVKEVAVKNVVSSFKFALNYLTPIGLAFNAAKWLGNNTDSGRSVLTKLGLAKVFGIKDKKLAPITGMDDVKKMIIRHEGWKNKAYKDSLGKWTIGVGHLIGDGSSPGEYEGKTLSNNEVYNLFDQDFAKYVNIAKKTPGYNKANIQGKGAMIDLAYNMGQWWDKWPNTAKKLIAADFKGAAEDLQNSKWYTQVGQRGAQIVSMIASAGAAVSPISPAQASPVETAAAAGGAPKQKAGDTAASPAAASPAPAALPKTPQTPGSPNGAASTPNTPPMAPSSGGAYSPASKNPNSGDKSAQYGMPNPAHTSFLDDLVAVMFNANDPAMGVSGL